MANGFKDISANLLLPGNGLVHTNFVDFGGATNGSARFYRIRLAP